MRRTLAVLLLGTAGLACGRQPCDPEDLEKGPRVRIDLALGYCNLPPVPEITGRSRVPKSTTVELDGSASTEPNDDPMTFSWKLASKPASSNAILTASGVKASFTPDVTGAYEVQLTISDGELTSAPKSIVIAAENDAPVADAGDNQLTDFGVDIGLDGSRSADPNGDPLRYTWTLMPAVGSSAALDDPSAVTPHFHADVRGQYEATLVVNDGETDSVADTVIIRAGVSASPPIARISAATMVLEGSEVTVDGAGSSDPDGDPLTYRWTLSPGPIGSRSHIENITAERTSFTPDAIGDFVVQLVVNDGFYDSPPATITITAGRSPNVLGSDMFDPDVMHFLASNAGGQLGLVCAEATFSRPSAGLPFPTQSPLIRPTDGKLIYVDPGSGALRIFTPDPLVLNALGEYDFPMGPTMNDTIIPTPACGTYPLFDFVMSPVTGDLYYSCLDDMARRTAYFDKNGDPLPAAKGQDVLAIGNDGAVLFDLVVREPSGADHPLTHFNHEWRPRAKPGSGFWAARSNGMLVERWSISSTGVETRDCTFAEIPSGFHRVIMAEAPKELTFDSEGNIYTFALRDDQDGIRVIFKHDCLGNVTIVYEGLPERICGLGSGTFLFSGP